MQTHSVVLLNSFCIVIYLTLLCKVSGITVEMKMNIVVDYFVSNILLIQKFSNESGQ